MKKILLILICLSICGCTSNQSDKSNAKSLINKDGEVLQTRILTPDGYQRISQKEGSFGDYVRSYELEADGNPVYLYNGDAKGNQSEHAAVFKLPLENYNLQQCADSIMRMYSEYYWHTKQYDKITFHLTDGFSFDYKRWREGYRLSYKTGKAVYTKTKSYDGSYNTFKQYLRILFAYAGTLSLEKESQSIELTDIQIGDFFIKGGSPGHVVMIVDICEKDGKKAFLLAQGYMPAQQFHVVVNKRHLNDPWYYEDEVTYPFKTASYTFDKNSLKRKDVFN